MLKHFTEKKLRRRMSEGDPYRYIAYPHTQGLTVIYLDRFFDLSQPGDYSLQVQINVPMLDGKGTTNVSSGAAFFEVVAKPLWNGAISTNQPQSIATREDGRCQLSVSTDNASFEINQPICLNSSLKNVSTNAMKISVRDGLMNYSITVIGPNEKPVRTIDYGDELIAPVNLFHQSYENVAPNQSWQETIPLSKVFVMTNTGAYKITVSRAIGNDQQVSAGPLFIEITNSIKNSLSN